MRILSDVHTTEFKCNIWFRLQWWTEANVSFSQGELETQKRQHEAKLITTKEEEKHKMDKMALELELKWTETLRCVCVPV